MARLTIFSGLLLAVVSASAMANEFLCPSQIVSPYLAIDPSHPRSHDSISIIAGKRQVDPDSVLVSVVGNTIDVTLVGKESNIGVPPPLICSEYFLGKISPGRYAVNLWFLDPSVPDGGITYQTTKNLEVTGAPDALSGLWWNPQQSGAGIYLSQRERSVFLAWFTYDDVGNPKWYVASSCQLDSVAPPSKCSGTLYETSGARFVEGVFVAADLRLSEVGSVQVEFADLNSANVSYDLRFTQHFLSIERQMFGTKLGKEVIDYTDLWWNPSESGWGLAIAHQSATMFLIWYAYDEEARSTWYVASDCRIVEDLGGTGCSGILYKASGPNFNRTEIRLDVVGDVSVRFGDSNSGTMIYRINGKSDQRSIVRQLF